MNLCQSTNKLKLHGKESAPTLFACTFDLRAPSICAYNAYACNKHNHVMNIHILCAPIQMCAYNEYLLYFTRKLAECQHLFYLWSLPPPTQSCVGVGVGWHFSRVLRIPAGWDSNQNSSDTSRLGFGERTPAVFPPTYGRKSSDSNRFSPTPPNSSRRECGRQIRNSEFR